MPTNGWNFQAKPGKMLPPVWGGKPVPRMVELPVVYHQTQHTVKVDPIKVRFTLPQGNKAGSNCGITAVAICASVTFGHAWDVVRQVRRDRGYPAGLDWVGGCSVMDRMKALDILGVKRVETVPARQTLMGWIKRETKPGVIYMVRTKDHVQMVCDGAVIDQNGCKPVAQYWGRRKFVTHITELTT